MSRKHQSILINDPECFQKLPPNVLLTIDGTTPNTPAEDTTSFVNFEVLSGNGGNTFVVVPLADSGMYWGTVYNDGNTGDGSLTVSALSPTTVVETFTVTCDNDDVEGAEVWSVTGSVTGGHANAVTGVEYTTNDGEVSFLIEASGTAFAATDEFTFGTFKRASYIKANKDCRLILEGLALRTTPDAAGGFTFKVGDVGDNYGQTGAGFSAGIVAPATVAYCTVSSTIILRAGQALSLYTDQYSGDTLAVGIQVSSVFPE